MGQMVNLEFHLVVHFFAKVARPATRDLHYSSIAAAIVCAGCGHCDTAARAAWCGTCGMNHAKPLELSRTPAQSEHPSGVSRS